MLLSDAAVLPRPADAVRPAAIRQPCYTCRFQKLNFCGALHRDNRRDRIAGSHRTIAARHNIYRAGEPSEGVAVVCDGWAVRFQQLPNGRRQILSVVLPGDLISAGAAFARQFAFSVQAVTSLRYCIFPVADVRARLHDDPALLDVWMQLAAAEHGDADRRLVDLGQRTALERIASLIFQIMLRVEERGELAGDEFVFPMSQQQMADCAGLTPVHTCRVLSTLRKSGVCDVGHGAIKILDRGELQRIAALK
jgi:CRP/FNR family transcriptional regulator, anaerobic regulatory protein